jgi:predicted CopG family antitoxin
LERYTSIPTMGSDTTIRVKQETWRGLHERKEPGDSMDDVIRDLLDSAEETAEVAR